jgi:hypothetical protein
MVQGREITVVSRPSVISVRLAGLERAQRFAGESFGHEELSLNRAASRLQGRLFWAFAGISSAVAVAVIALH